MSFSRFSPISSVDKFLIRFAHEAVGQAVGQLMEEYDMSRQAVTKHLVVLEEVNFVTTRN